MHTPYARPLLTLGAAALLASGCGGDYVTLDAPMVVATYNAGLIDGFVGYSNERVDPVAMRIATETVDVLCMEEVWEAVDWATVSAATASALPYTFRPADMPGTGVGVACDPAGELDDLDMCAMTYCDGLEGADLVDCALAFDTCALTFLGLGEDCQACLIANINEGTVAGFRAACEVDGTGGKDVFASGGSFGTALLSAYPLTDTEHHVMEATAVRRGVIYAKATGTPLGDVHLFCTHLSADLGIVPLLNPDPAYPASSWAQENQLQIADLIGYIQSKATDGAPVILLGDLNTGPAIADTNVVAELPNSYPQLVSAGFDSQYLEHGSGECTFCASNDLTDVGTSDVVIDHVMTLDLPRVRTTAERFMTDTVDLTVGMSTVTTNYSDHYGVRVTFGP